MLSVWCQVCDVEFVMSSVWFTFIFCGSGSSSFSECESWSGCLKMRIRIQIKLNKVCKKINAWRVLYSCKTHKRLLKSKKQWSFGQINFQKNSINLQFLAISLHFFCFYLKNFPSWIRIHILNTDPDPDPGDKMNADPQPWCAVECVTLSVWRWVCEVECVMSCVWY